MKKNLIRLASLIITVALISGTSIAVFAGSWSGEATVSTPNFGGVKYENTKYSGKDTNDLNGTVYATYQKTSLAHSIALTYLNYKQEKVIGSTWVEAKVDTIKRPELYLTTPGTMLWSEAKSHNVEPTANTVVKYKFSADKM